MPNSPGQGGARRGSAAGPRPALPAQYAERVARPFAPSFGELAAGPAGVLLIVGGLLGFLPILGFWMLPLGIALLSLDIALLRRPTARG